MSIFRWIFALIVIAAVGFITLKSLHPVPPPLTQVTTVKAQKATITRTVTSAGKIEPRRKVNVSCNITGTLIDLKVGIGSVVKKDQYLGQVETTRYQSVLDQQHATASAAESDLRRSEANLDHLRQEQVRVEALFQKGAGSSQDVDQARSATRVAEAEVSSARSHSAVAKGQVAEAQSSLSWATLKAPIDGTVLAVNHQEGERIRGSDFSEDVVLTIGSLDSVDVRIEIGEHDVVFIRPGQPATIEIDSLPDLQLKGKVIDSGRDAIVKNAGTDNEITTFPVWVTLDNPPDRTLSGMSAQVSIATETKSDVVAVPIQAVTVRATQLPPPPAQAENTVKGGPAPPSAPVGAPKSKLDKVVFTLKDGVVHKRHVTTGISSESQVEIVDGLTEGEEVVDGPYRVLARQLEDGAKVDVAPPPGGPGGPGMGGMQ